MKLLHRLRKCTLSLSPYFFLKITVFCFVFLSPQISEKKMNNENTSRNLSFNYKETLNAVQIRFFILMVLSSSKFIGHKKKTP